MKFPTETPPEMLAFLGKNLEREHSETPLLVTTDQNLIQFRIL